MTVTESLSAAQKPRRRWYQYSLTTLLIVTTVWSVLLGIWFKSYVVILTSKNFDSYRNRCRGPLLVEFDAEWCVVSPRTKPVVEELACDFRWSATVGKLDIDACPEIRKRYQVDRVPTFLLFRGGKVVEKRVGFTDKETLAKLLTKGGHGK